MIDQTEAAYNRTKDLYFFQFLLQAKSNIGKRRKGINAVPVGWSAEKKRRSNEKTSSGGDGQERRDADFNYKQERIAKWTPGIVLKAERTWLFGANHERERKRAGGERTNALLHHSRWPAFIRFHWVDLAAVQLSHNAGHSPLRARETYYFISSSLFFDPRIRYILPLSFPSPGIPIITRFSDHPSVSRPSCASFDHRSFSFSSFRIVSPPRISRY